jgi:hypothetical protein
MTIATFRVISPVTQANAPFAYGHVFKKGDIPAGQFVDSDLTDWQANPTTYWPDGSVRHAIISGRANTTANVLKDIVLSASTTNRTGTALTEADLLAALPSGTNVTCTLETMNLSALVGTAALHRTVCTGPVMSNWIYRKQKSGSNHLVVWFDVRLYKGGTVEIFPWVENGFLTVAAPAAVDTTCRVFMGDAEVYVQTFTVKHHTRIPLVDGATHSYWSVDPQITPHHDTAYLMDTKMVPHYGYAPSDTTLSNTSQFPVAYNTNMLGTTTAAMGNTGYAAHIGILPNWAAGYLASGGDARAYKATIVNGMAAGSWPVHYRDETTNEPLKFTDYPNISITWGGSPAVPSGTGGVNKGNNVDASPDRGHQPSFGFLPWLLTGRWFFLDEHLLWFTWNYLQTNYQMREGAKSIYFDEQTRSRAWTLRTHAQALAIIPESHPCFASFKTSWEANTDAYQARYITGTRDAGTWANNLGVVGLYNGAGAGSLYFSGDSYGYWWEANWQQQIFSLAFGTAWDMDLPQSTASKNSLLAVRNFVYKVPIGMAGDGSPGTYNYRRFSIFEFPVGTDGAQPPTSWLADYGAVYAAQMAYGYDNANRASGVTALPAIPPGTDLYYGATPVGADMWGWHSVVAFGRTALSLAVDHGVTGAAEAYGRLTGASNYSTASFSDYSLWALTPRAEPEVAVGPTIIAGARTRADTSSLVTGKTVAGNRGLGVLGSAVPTTGTHGGGALALGLTADELTAEVRAVITVQPAHGTVVMDETSAFTYTRTDGQTGTDSFTFEKFVAGVSQGTAVKTVSIGVAAVTLAGTNSTEAATSSTGTLGVSAPGTPDTITLAGTSSVEAATSSTGTLSIAAAGSVALLGTNSTEAATSSTGTLGIFGTSPSNFMVEVPVDEIGFPGVLQDWTKQPGETLDYDVSFVKWLERRAVPDSATMAVVTAPDGITLHAFTLNNGVVKLWISGGTDGESYKFTILLTTAAGRVKEVEILIKIRDT